MSGKDGDGTNWISLYLIEYQKKKIPLKIILSGKSGTFVKYQDISRIIWIYVPFPWRNFGCCHWGNLKQVPLYFGFVVAVVNIQQFQYSVFPFVPVLFGEFLAHQEYQIAYTYFLSRFYFSAYSCRVKIHIGIEIWCGNFFELFSSHTSWMSESNFMLKYSCCSSVVSCWLIGSLDLFSCFPSGMYFFNISRKRQFWRYMSAQQFFIYWNASVLVAFAGHRVCLVWFFPVIFSLAAFIYSFLPVFPLRLYVPVTNGIIPVVGFIQRFLLRLLVTSSWASIWEYLSMCW